MHQPCRKTAHAVLKSLQLPAVPVAQLFVESNGLLLLDLDMLELQHGLAYWFLHVKSLNGTLPEVCSLF